MSWAPEDDEPPRRAPSYRNSTSLCPCDECTADDGAGTTDLDVEDYQ